MKIIMEKRIEGKFFEKSQIPKVSKLKLPTIYLVTKIENKIVIESKNNKKASLYFFFKKINHFKSLYILFRIAFL